MCGVEPAVDAALGPRIRKSIIRRVRSGHSAPATSTVRAGAPDYLIWGGTSRARWADRRHEGRRMNFIGSFVKISRICTWGGALRRN